MKICYFCIYNTDKKEVCKKRCSRYRSDPLELYSDFFVFDKLKIDDFVKLLFDKEIIK